MRIVITETIEIDHCWVCSSPEALEEHHLVPRAYGGLKGPTVTLCGTCHSVLHAESHKPKNARRFKRDRIQGAKLLYLSEVVFRARIATRRLVRGRMLAMKLDPELHAKVKAMMQVKGTKSIEQTIVHIIRAAYSQTFPLE